MPDIFLSYATADKARVAPLANQLGLLGYDVWWDVDIPPGKRWEQVILGTLEDSKAVVVVWTEASIVSEWVYEEAEYGKRNNILIPVFLDDCQAPMGFRMRQGARLIEWGEDTSTKEWQGVLKSLESLLGTPPMLQKQEEDIAADEVDLEDEDLLYPDDDESDDEAEDVARPKLSREDFSEYLASIKMPRSGADVRQDLAISLEEAFTGNEVDVDVENASPPHRLRIKIPRGIEDAARIRLRGEGGAGRDGGPNGDLYLFVSVAPHPAFERDGANLYARTQVAVTKAMLGGDVIVRTLDGDLTIHIPPGTQAGQRFNVPSRGMTKLNSEDRGDLYVEAEIEIPRSLDAHSSELVRKLAHALKT